MVSTENGLQQNLEVDKEARSKQIPLLWRVLELSSINQIDGIQELAFWENHNEMKEFLASFGWRFLQLWHSCCTSIFVSNPMRYVYLVIPLAILQYIIWHTTFTDFLKFSIPFFFSNRSFYLTEVMLNHPLH